MDRHDVVSYLSISDEAAFGVARPSWAAVLGRDRSKFQQAGDVSETPEECWCTGREKGEDD